MTADNQTRQVHPDKRRLNALCATLRAAIEQVEDMRETLARIDAVVCELEALGKPATLDDLMRRAVLLDERDALRERVLAHVVEHGRRGWSP